MSQPAGRTLSDLLRMPPSDNLVAAAASGQPASPTSPLPASSVVRDDVRMAMSELDAVLRRASSLQTEEIGSHLDSLQHELDLKLNAMVFLPLILPLLPNLFTEGLSWNAVDKKKLLAVILVFALPNMAPVIERIRHGESILSIISDASLAVSVVGLAILSIWLKSESDKKTNLPKEPPQMG